MKVNITMEITRVKNKLTREMTDITDDIGKNPLFRKAVESNTEQICKQLEKYFKKQGIQSKFNYYFE